MVYICILINIDDRKVKMKKLSSITLKSLGMGFINATVMDREQWQSYDSSYSEQNRKRNKKVQISSRFKFQYIKVNT